MNLGKPVNVPQLNEAMAIELGANMLGETIVFSIAAGILYFEYARQVSFVQLKFLVCVLFSLEKTATFLFIQQSQKELAKEKARQEELSQLNYTIQQMYFTVSC